MSYIWQKKGWPKLKWSMEKLGAQLAAARFSQGGLVARMEALGLSLSVEAQAEVLVSEAVKTSEVEGTILNANSVRSSVAKRLGLPAAGLTPPDRYTEGIVEMLLDATTNFSKPLTEKRLKGWQAALFPTGFSGIHKIRAGLFRGREPMLVISGPVGKERIHYEAPPFQNIEKEMSEFSSWWKESLGKMDGLIRAGVAHFYFVTIHPFEDGNGRIARALTDMALAQDENLGQRFYSLSSQIMTERDSYYDILESSQKGDVDITAWLEWFLECTDRAIKNSEKIISNVLAKAAFWQRFASVQMNERQKKVISRLLDAGRGGFEGGLTTRKYVSIAKTSRATAFREITDLLQKGIIKQNEGAGRSASYDLIWVE